MANFLPKLHQRFDLRIVQIPSSENVWCMRSHSVPCVNLLFRLVKAVLTTPQEGSDEHII